MVPRDDAEVYDVSEIYLPVTEKISKSSYCASEKRYLLKWYYDQKIISIFSSDFESVFV